MVPGVARPRPAKRRRRITLLPLGVCRCYSKWCSRVVGGRQWLVLVLLERGVMGGGVPTYSYELSK
jgi:hypothetical protein